MAKSSTARRAWERVAKSSRANVQAEWIYSISLYLILFNRIFSQIGPNLGIDWLGEMPLAELAVALLMIRFVALMPKMKLGELFLAVATLCLSAISMMSSKQSYLLVTFLLLYGIGNIDLRKLLKNCGRIVLCTVAFLGILQCLVYILSGSLPGAVTRESGRVRLSFFFVHPNFLAALTTMAFIAVSLGWRKLNARHLFLGLCLAGAILVVTDSKTSTFILILYLVIRYFMQARPPEKQRWLTMVIASLPIFCSILVILTMMNSMPGVLYRLLQKVLTGRPGYWLLQFEQMGGWTMLGRQTIYGDYYYNGWLYPAVTIDCYYAAALLQLGSWSLIFFIGLYLNSIYKFSNKNDTAGLCVLMSCALFGFTEVHMVDMAVCYPLLVLGENFSSFKQTLRSS